MTEQRGSQYQARDNLADHSGLAQCAQQLVTDARRGDHDDQLQQRDEQQVLYRMD